MAKIKLVPVQKRVIMGSVIGVLIITAGILLWQRFDSPIDQEKKVPFSQGLGEVQVAATDYLESGDTDGGLKYYDDQIDQTQADEEKKVLLTLKSGFAIGAEKFDTAISAAKQADQLGSDATTIRALADAYRASGDSEQALIYYKQLIKMRDKEAKPDDGQVYVQRGPSIEDVIEAME